MNFILSLAICAFRPITTEFSCESSAGKACFLRDVAALSHAQFSVSACNKREPIRAIARTGGELSIVMLNVTAQELA